MTLVSTLQAGFRVRIALVRERETETSAADCFLFIEIRE